MKSIFLIAGAWIDIAVYVVLWVITIGQWPDTQGFLFGIIAISLWSLSCSLPRYLRAAQPKGKTEE